MAHSTQLTLLNERFEAISIVDAYETLIWTDRYYGYGDFELTGPTSVLIVEPDFGGPYFTIPQSEHTMVIENMSIKTSADSGDKVVAKGRSLETILERRIIWNETILTGNLQDGIQKLLNENAINPALPERKISKLVFIPSTDPVVTALTINNIYVGQTLYVAIADLCLKAKIGFKIVLTVDGRFEFSLYSGKDRSYDQSINPYVVFSPEFDNLLNGEYNTSNDKLKTVVLVSGEGGGDKRKMMTVSGSNSGGTELTRREMYVDASVTPAVLIDRGTITAQQYLDLTLERGQEFIDDMELNGLDALGQNVALQTFEGETQTTGTFTYGEDFFMGDLVQVQDDYAHIAVSRVTELIRSVDADGTKVYPKFVTEHN